MLQDGFIAPTINLEEPEALIADLHVPRTAPFEVTEANTVRGVVNVIEPTAAGSTVYLSSLEDEPQDFVATFKQRVPSSYLEKEIPLAVNMEKAHFFDPATERSLLVET